MSEPLVITHIGGAAMAADFLRWVRRATPETVFCTVPRTRTFDARLLIVDALADEAARIEQALAVWWSSDEAGQQEEYK